MLMFMDSFHREPGSGKRHMVTSWSKQAGLGASEVHL